MAKYVKKYRNDGKMWYVYKCGYCGSEIKSHARSPKSHCPNKACGLTKTKSMEHWYKPPTEVKLFMLQEKFWRGLNEELFEKYYLEMKKPEEERNEEILIRHENQVNKEVRKEMYLTIHSYTEALLKKYIKKNNFYLNPEEFEDKWLQTSFIVYNQVLARPYKVEASWAGLIKWKIIEALYKFMKDEKNEHLDKIINYDKDTEMLETIGLEDIKPLHRGQLISDPYQEHHDIINELKKVVGEIYTQVLRVEGDFNDKEGRKQSLLTLIGFIFFLKGESKKTNILYENYGSVVRDNVEAMNVTIRRYLRNIIKEE